LTRNKQLNTFFTFLLSLALKNSLPYYFPSEIFPQIIQTQAIPFQIQKYQIKRKSAAAATFRSQHTVDQIESNWKSHLPFGIRTCWFNNCTALGSFKSRFFLTRLQFKNSHRVTVYASEKKIVPRRTWKFNFKNSQTRQFNFPKMFSCVDLTSNFVYIQKILFLINGKKESEIFVIKNKIQQNQQNGF